MILAKQEKKRAIGRAVNWMASSIFGLAGTVLLVCWLLAYALEPSGVFAKVGLVLAIAAYCVDLVKEEAAGRRLRARQAAGLDLGRGKGSGASVPKAA
jgi:Flp pilus assembly protein TadB